MFVIYHFTLQKIKCQFIEILSYRRLIQANMPIFVVFRYTFGTLIYEIVHIVQIALYNALKATNA